MKINPAQYLERQYLLTSLHGVNGATIANWNCDWLWCNEYVCGPISCSPNLDPPPKRQNIRTPSSNIWLASQLRQTPT